MTKQEALAYIADKIREDEPVFILRGQDILAAKTIFQWEDTARLTNVRKEKRYEAIETAGAFLRYDGPTKLPD